MRDSGNVQRAEHPNGRALSKLSARDLVPGEERGSTQCDRVKEPARLDALPASSLKCAARALRLHPALPCPAPCLQVQGGLRFYSFKTCGRDIFHHCYTFNEGDHHRKLRTTNMSIETILDYTLYHRVYSNRAGTLFWATTVSSDEHDRFETFTAPKLSRLNQGLVF